MIIDEEGRFVTEVFHEVCYLLAEERPTELGCVQRFDFEYPKTIQQ